MSLYELAQCGRACMERLALVVEDHIVTRRALCSLLASVGIESIAAGTVAEAVALLERRPACIVLDLLLPDGTGLDVMLAVRRMGLQTRIVISTGAGDPDLLGAALALGPEALLQKPHGATLLLDLIQGAIRSAESA
jgi:two-component system, NarL family, response regulator DevR